jgi:type II secretory pathway component PulC
LLETGSRIKIMTGFLVLISLLVLWYSGVKLLLLYDTPLFGVSSESKLAKQKWNNLETLQKEKGEKDWATSIDLLIKSIPVTETQNNPELPVSSQEIQEAVRYEEMETLPVITGIIIPSDSLEKSKASVIINGNIYTENDEVSGYMIKKITKEGVSFKRKGKHFFADAPKVLYSVDQGD